MRRIATLGAAMQLGIAGSRLLALVALVLGLGFAVLGSGGAYAQAPAAGAVIGNQATATYTDSGGTARTATSNLVQTTVAQVYSHTLTASQSRTVAPGGTVYYPHTLSNTGNGADTYTLGAVDGGGNAAVTFTLGTNVFIYADTNGDGVPDNATAITTSGSVPAGGVFRFVIAAQWPGAVTTGSETITVNTTGNAGDASNSPAAAGTNTDTATVTGNAVISVVKSMSVASGPSPSTGNITVTLQYTNTGSATATGVLLFDQLPAGFTYQAGTGVWSGGGTLTDADAGAESASISYCANQATPANLPCVTGSIAAQIASVAPGASGTLAFQIAVAAGQPIGLISNTARFCYNDGTGQVPAACTTGSGSNVGTTGTATNAATYNVVQSFSVRLDDSGPGGAAPVSFTDASAANNDQIVVNAADQGSVVQFENIVTNTGNGTDTFNMTIVSNTFPAGTTFTFYNATNSAPLTDTNGDGIPDTGTLAANASTRVWVRAQLPPNATGNAANFQVVKRATSVGNSGVGDNTTDVLGSINRRQIDLTNTSAGGPGSGFQATGEAAGAVTTNLANPGTSTNFQLVVANAGPGADNFDLIATSNNTGINTASPTITLPAGWAVTFRLGTCAAPGATVTNTGNVAAGGNVTVCATVALPANASAGTTDIYFRAASPSGASYSNTAPSQYAAFDVKRDAVTVNAVFNLSFTPDRAGQIFPAGNTVYAHTVCNNGNTALAAGSITLTFSNNTAGFTSALWVDMNANGAIDVGTDTPITSGSTYGSALAAGACVTLLDNVFAPAGATNGTVNVTTITATHATAAPGGVSVTDTSTVVSGDLQIVKQHRTIGCSGAGPGVYTQAALPAQAPGACVQYQIVATNSGAANLTSLTVSDSTPAFTTLETGACAVTATRSDAVLVTPGGTAADEAAGTVTATVATLPPLVSMTLTFCVQINN